MTKNEMQALVKKAVPKIWQQINADAGDCDLYEAAELCLDADRPVTCGAMTADQYTELCGWVPPTDIDKWACEALKGLV